MCQNGILNKKVNNINRKTIIEKIKETVPNFEENEEKELKIALFIYIKLAEIKQFDDQYYFGNNKICNELYKKAKEKSKNIKEIQNKKKLICVTLSSLYIEILRKFGIEADLVKEDEDDVHTLTYIRMKKGKIIRADIQRDMLNIKTKSKIEFFNYLDNEKIGEKELTKILIDIGYVYNEKDYNDKTYKKLRNKIKEEKANEITKIIITQINKNLKSQKNLGTTEMFRLIRHIIETIVPVNIRIDSIHVIPCINRNNGKFTILIYSIQNEEIQIYLYSQKHNNILKCNLDTIKTLKENGLEIGITKKERGLRKLNKFLKNNKYKSKDKI